MYQLFTNLNYKTKSSISFRIRLPADVAAIDSCIRARTHARSHPQVWSEGPVGVKAIDGAYFVCK